MQELKFSLNQRFREKSQRNTTTDLKLASKESRKQVNKQGSKQARKQGSKQARKRASEQGGKQANNEAHWAYGINAADVG